MASARYFGLDLAWSDGNGSGACAVDTTGTVIDEQILDDDASVFTWIESLLDGPAVIGADIPLQVPNEEGSRGCDRAVASAYGARGAGPHPANRSLFMSRFGRIRGEDLARRLRALGFGGPFDPPTSGPARTMLEVYPHPGLVETFDLSTRLSYKKGTLQQRRRGLSQLRRLLAGLEHGEPPLGGPHISIPRTASGRQLKSIEDRLDARFCAWTAATWERGCALVFGDVDGGHIVVARPCPPLSE